MAEIKYVDWDGLVYYDGKSKQYINDKFHEALKFGGSYSFTDVPSPGIDTLNFTYKITDDFIVAPDSLEFVDECVNKEFAHGSIIIVVDAGNDVYKFDVLFEAITGGLPTTPDGEIDLSNYYTKDEVEAIISESGFATEEFVTTAINAIEIPEMPEVPTKLSQLENDVGYLTEHQDISGKADKEHTHSITDIVDYQEPDLSEYAKKEDIPVVDLSGYYNKEEVEDIVDEAVDSIEIPKIPTNISAFSNDVGYLTTHQSLEGYAKTDQIPTKLSELTDDTTFVDEAELQTKVDELITAFSGDLDDKAEKDHTHSISEITDYQEPDLSGYALKTEIPTDYVTEEELNSKGFLTEHQDLSEYAKLTDIPEYKEPDLSGYALKSEIPTDYLKEVPHEYITETELNEKGFLTQHQDLSDYAKKTDIPDVSNFITEIPFEYVTETELSQKGYLTEHQSLDDYAKKSDIPDVSNFISEIPEQYVTDEELTAKGYITQHQDISHLATKDEIPDVSKFIETIPEEYITDEELTAKGYLTEHQDISGKADAIPFTTDFIVGKAVGDFIEGDSVKGLSIREILIKILDLSDSSKSVVDVIIDDELHAYHLNEAGELEEITYKYSEWTEEEAKAIPTETEADSTFYQIKDSEGNIIESGYQLYTMSQETDWLTIAIPDIITNYRIEQYNDDISDYQEVNWKLEPVAEQTIPDYTILRVPEMYEVMSGITIRIVIIE